jgi:hypothetical protein
LDFERRKPKRFKLWMGVDAIRALGWRAPKRHVKVLTVLQKGNEVSGASIPVG